jgi:hypothetical protein
MIMTLVRIGIARAKVLFLGGDANLKFRPIYNFSPMQAGGARTKVIGALRSYPRASI